MVWVFVLTFDRDSHRTHHHHQQTLLYLGRVVVVLGRHGLHLAEARIAEGRDGGLGAPGQHDVGLPVGDGLEAQPQRVRGGGAGGVDDCVVGFMGWVGGRYRSISAWLCV